MFEAKLTIEAPGLAAALEHLAAAISHRTDAVTHTDTRVQNTVVPSIPAVPVSQVPNPAPAPNATVTAPPSTAATQVAAPPVPLATAPSYTKAQVGKAGADLIAANPAKMPELLGLLGQFGVQAIMELTPEQLGPFATALRGLGANL